MLSLFPGGPGGTSIDRLTRLTGAGRAGRLAFTCAERPGTLPPIAMVVRQFNLFLITLVVSSSAVLRNLAVDWVIGASARDREKSNRTRPVVRLGPWRVRGRLAA
ncbi:MAG TPA: hypothetical protein PLX89_25885 [Verrucomicrobiota bacterium]|nr:hypothetical protein [Verrucomicrobiota bacterium]